MGIIGISGKINSGKDTVGKIIQILTQSPHFSDETVVSFLDRKLIEPRFVNKKFADTLKDIVCLLIGCTREQLEDREFKEKELGEEWTQRHFNWVRESELTLMLKEDGLTIQDKLDKGEYELYENLMTEERLYRATYADKKLTPRKLLQLMGTECGRNILHPNIWVNAVMAKYKAKGALVKTGGKVEWKEYPNWIITDMRFPNELKAVKDRGGISIRVNRPKKIESTGYIIMDMASEDRTKDTVVKYTEHESETALDNAKFQYTIANIGTLKELVEMVRQILKKEELI